MILGDMLRRLAAFTAAFMLWAPGARAEPPAPAPSPPHEPASAASAPSETGPSFGDRFFRGTTPGELPTEKLALIATLYAGAATSIGVGIASFVSAGSKHDAAENFKHAQEPGFCDDLASSSCATYRRLLDDERSRRETGIALLGLGGLLVLGGALTAELWHNETAPAVAVDVNARGVSLAVGGRF
jgi:hypothetical protein